MSHLETHGSLLSTPQDESLVTYAHKLEKAESAIDWNRSAEEISRQVRAFNPFPVAQSYLRGEVCRIWMATTQVADTSAISGSVKAGEIIDVHDGVLVACGKGVLRITELQAPGGKRLGAQAFVQGHNLKAGDVFTAAIPSVTVVD